MGHHEIGARDRLALRPEEIEINRARPPRHGAHPAKLQLDRKQGAEERSDLRVFDEDGRVQERPLGRSSYRHGLVNSGSLLHTGNAERSGEKVLEAVSKVGAEPDDELLQGVLP